jgi:hypothetical protein
MTTTATTGRPMADECYEQAAKLQEATHYLHRLYASQDAAPLSDEAHKALVSKYEDITRSVDAFVAELDAVQTGRRQQAAQILRDAAGALGEGQGPVNDARLVWAARVAGLRVNETEQVPF